MTLVATRAAFAITPASVGRLSGPFPDRGRDLRGRGSG